MQWTTDQDGWVAHEREQLRARLAMTYAERLRWLEQAKRFAQRALGAAATSVAGRGSSETVPVCDAAHAPKSDKI